METRIEVDNISCGGCATTISRKLLEQTAIQNVQVDIANQTVIIESTTDIRSAAVAQLLKLGYPERGSVEGLASLKEKAKSVVSCAIGRVELATKS